jgi:hypothetical protein
MAKSIYEDEVTAPEFFDISVESCGQSEAQEWTVKASAFVESMNALDRAVLLKFDPESKEISLSSIEAGVGK